MGLHQDKDEEDFAAPVVSVSLGDSADLPRRRPRAKDPTHAFELKSGDVVVLGGDDRLAYHGIDRILRGTSDSVARGRPPQSDAAPGDEAWLVLVVRAPAG